MFKNYYDYSLADIEYLKNLKQLEGLSEESESELDKILKSSGLEFQKAFQKNIEKSIFLQSDGSRLRYAFPEDYGSQYPHADRKWFRTFQNERLNKESKSKERQVKLGLWSSYMDHSHLILIAADFDKIPNGYNSFDELASYLEKSYVDKGIILRTRSNKCKVLFQIKISNLLMDHTKISTTALRQILNENLFEFCDLSKPALSIAFVTPQNIKIISSKLRSLKPVFDEAEHNIKYNVAVPLSPKSTSAYKENEGVSIVCKDKKIPLRKYNGVIEGALADYVNTPVEIFLRALMCSPRLLKKMQINQTYFANELNVKQFEISRYIRRLIDDRILVRLKGGYKIGILAYHYRAKGALKVYLQQATQTYPTQDYPIPTFINDGMWNITLFTVAMTHFKHDAEGFLVWAKGLPYADQEDRPKKIGILYEKLKGTRTP